MFAPVVTTHDLTEAAVVLGFSLLASGLVWILEIACDGGFKVEMRLVQVELGFVLLCGANVHKFVDRLLSASFF